MDKIIIETSLKEILDDLHTTFHREKTYENAANQMLKDVDRYRTLLASGKMKVVK